MLFIIKPLSFPTLLLTELPKTAVVCMNTLIDIVSVINRRYSPIIYKFAFPNNIGKGSAQILDSTFLGATQEQGKFINMHHYLKPNMYHSWLELWKTIRSNTDSSWKEFFEVKDLKEGYMNLLWACSMVPGKS